MRVGTPETNASRSDRPYAPAWPVIAVFAVFLLMPALAQVAGFGVASTENRVLAEFPSLRRLKELKDLPRNLDAYINDRFGLRSQFVYLNSALRYRLGISSTKDVAIGQDGWLFYTRDKILEQHTGADRFTPAQLENWVRRMEAYRDWLQRRGIAFYIVVAPEKSTIYPEKLPDHPRPPGTLTRLDQLVERLKMSSLEFVDSRAPLLEAKAEGQKVYFEADTHWTQRGAFVVYTALMKRIMTRFRDIQPLTEPDYDVSANVRPVMDLAGLLALGGDFCYEVERFEVKGKRHQLAPSTRTFRTGWPQRVEEIKTDLATRPRLLVFGDSFTDYVLGPDFLYETFRDPVWTYHNLGAFNLRLVDEVKPDIVLFEFAERYLHSPLGPPWGIE